MNNYEFNFLQINSELNRLEPFFRAEFSRKVGEEALKIINREQHPTAHLILRNEKGTQYGRLTKACKVEMVDYDEVANAPVMEDHISFQLTSNKYRINASVEYLFAQWDTQTELDTELTRVLMLDSQKISKYLDEFTLGGNHRLAEKGLPVINGVVSLPISLLASMGAVINAYTINWTQYSYTNIHGETRPMLPASIQRAWGRYRLAMVPPKHKVVAICKETREVYQYDSLTNAAISLLVSNPNTETEAGKKRIATATGCISNAVQGRTRRVHSKDGLWFAIFDYDEVKKMETAGTLKAEIDKRFAKQTRKPRTKKCEASLTFEPISPISK